MDRDEVYKYHFTLIPDRCLYNYQFVLFDKFYRGAIERARLMSNLKFPHQEHHLTYNYGGVLPMNMKKYKQG
jgi:hypothetical protein